MCCTSLCKPFSSSAHRTATIYNFHPQFIFEGLVHSVFFCSFFRNTVIRHVIGLWHHSETVHAYPTRHTHTSFSPRQINSTILLSHVITPSYHPLHFCSVYVPLSVRKMGNEHTLSRNANLTHIPQTHTPASYSSPSDTALLLKIGNQKRMDNFPKVAVVAPQNDHLSCIFHYQEA